MRIIGPFLILHHLLLHLLAQDWAQAQHEDSDGGEVGNVVAGEEGAPEGG